MSNKLLPLTTRKKDQLIEQGAELSGYIVKRENGSYAIIADARVINLSDDEFRVLMGYPGHSIK